MVLKYINMIKYNNKNSTRVIPNKKICLKLHVTKNSSNMIRKYYD